MFATKAQPRRLNIAKKHVHKYRRLYLGNRSIEDVALA